MKLILVILLFFIFSFSLSSELYIYQPYEIISFFNKTPISQERCEIIKNSLLNILKEYYAFYEIAKNPPQPDFDPNYHSKVDLGKELEQLETKNRDFYSFYQDLKKIIFKTKDLHFIFDYDNIGNYLDMFNYLFPIALIISKDDNGKEYIYGANYIQEEEIKKKFRNSETIFDIIEKNKNNKIISINGKDPFDFISDFGQNYLNLRSPHGNFFFKYRLIQEYFLSSFPLRKWR